MKQVLPSMLEQSLRGYHALFDPDVVRVAMTHVPEEEAWVPPQLAERTETLLDMLEGSDDLDTQRALVDAAPREVQEVLCFLYFDAVYRYMEHTQPTVH